MEHASGAERVIVLGIDPGRNTGLYSVSIPRKTRALTLDEFRSEARWLGNGIVSLSSSKNLSLSEKWGHMAERLKAAVSDCDADFVVLEYPADGMPKWSGGTARGIDFGMGLFFGFAVLACEPMLNTNIALMPVTSSKAKNRVGWMPKVTERSRNGNRVVTHTQNRNATLGQCRETAHAIGINSGEQASEDVELMSDHELMALGVLTYYVTNRAPADWGK